MLDKLLLVCVHNRDGQGFFVYKLGYASDWSLILAKFMKQVTYDIVTLAYVLLSPLWALKQPSIQLLLTQNGFEERSHAILVRGTNLNIILA